MAIRSAKTTRPRSPKRSPLRKAMWGDDPAAIETATQTLTTASHKLAEEMYKKVSAAAGVGAAEAKGTSMGMLVQAKTDEKVVDAEFEEVDKDKKSAPNAGPSFTKECGGPVAP